MLSLRTVSIAVATAALLSASSPPMLAQGLGEYGAAASRGGSSSNLASTLAAIEYTVRHSEPRTWIIASVSAVIVWFVFLRKR